MSKKTKRLEKENLNLTRKQEATNKNIFQMAEERSQSQQALDRLTRENEKLKKLCRAMQAGGYGVAEDVAAGLGAAAEGHHEFDEALEGETESEYDDEEYDEDEEGEEYEDETDDDDSINVVSSSGAVRRTYGPPPPPPPSHPQRQDLPNGKLPQQQVNGAASINGTRH